MSRSQEQQACLCIVFVCGLASIESQSCCLCLLLLSSLIICGQKLLSSLITVDRDVMACWSVCGDVYVRHRCVKIESKLASLFNNKSRLILAKHNVSKWHRRSQRVQWVHLHPPGRRKIFSRPNFQEKMCKCTPAGHEVHPQPEQGFCWVA